MLIICWREPLEGWIRITCACMRAFVIDSHAKEAGSHEAVQLATGFTHPAHPDVCIFTYANQSRGYLGIIPTSNYAVALELFSGGHAYRLK